MNDLVLRILFAALVLSVSVGGAYVAGKRHVQQEWDAEVSERLATALEAERMARAVETRRRQEVDDAVGDARAKTLRALDDADAARAAADGLRWAASSAAGGCASGDPTASGRSQADELADVVARCGQRYREVAAIADAAIIAGNACERAYVGLTR